MVRSRCDTCPMCNELRMWRVGDRVSLLLGDQGQVLGVNCDSCGGWRDDDALAQLEDELVTALGFRAAAARPDHGREAERPASEVDAVHHQDTPSSLGANAARPSRTWSTAPPL